MAVKRLPTYHFIFLFFPVYVGVVGIKGQRLLVHETAHTKRNTNIYHNSEY